MKETTKKIPLACPPHASRSGVALVMVIFLMVLCSLVAVTAFSLLVQDITGGLGYSQSIEALAIAMGGKEWYLQQLADDGDWTDEAGQTGIALGSGAFDITIAGSPGANTVTFIVTGKVPGYFNQTVQRQLRLTANRLPEACQFAVFWQLDGPGTKLELATGGGGTHISGNFWSAGSSRIDSPCSVTNGVVYYGAGETVDGSGTYASQEVHPPFADMPAIDTAYYDNLIADWNGRIDDADVNNHGQSSGPNLTLHSDVNWTNQAINRRDIDTNGHNITGTNFTVNCRYFNLQNGSEIDSGASGFTINCRQDFEMTGSARINANGYRINCSRHFTMSGTSAIHSSDFEIYLDDDFNTEGTTSVTGYGYIVCSNAGQVLLHHQNSDSGAFTATPSGGHIYFLSGDSMIINSNRSDTAVTLYPGCFLYSRNPSGADELLRIKNEDTAIYGATIVAGRRIIVEEGADITNSTLYVDFAGSDSNNYLQITDSATTVSGAVISRGRDHPSLRINSGASVTGLIYQYGSPTLGRTEIDGNSTITGSLLVRQFQSDSLGPVTINYDLSEMLSVLPAGLPGHATEQRGSWNDN